MLTAQGNARLGQWIQEHGQSISLVGSALLTALKRSMDDPTNFVAALVGAMDGLQSAYLPWFVGLGSMQKCALNAGQHGGMQPAFDRVQVDRPIGLNGMLIQPVQRLPAYEPRIKDLGKLCGIDVKAAIDRLKATNAFLNNELRKSAITLEVRGEQATSDIDKTWRIEKYTGLWKRWEERTLRLTEQSLYIRGGTEASGGIKHHDIHQIHSCILDKDKVSFHLDVESWNEEGKRHVYHVRAPSVDGDGKQILLDARLALVDEMVRQIKDHACIV